MKINVLRWLASAGAAGFLALILADSAAAQVLPGKRAAQPAAPAAPAAPRDAVKGVRDAPPAARREAREATRDAREAPADARREAREDVRDAQRDARETGREAREDVRDARQGARQTARDINRATRAADLGVWFNTRAAGGVANGLAIADLAANGVFVTAGFREGDRLVSINGQPITTETQFVQLLTAPTREQISVVVFRDGQQQTIQLQPTVITQGIVNNDPFYQYGVLIDDRNPNQIIITRVFPRTSAYYAGLRPGDVIVGVGGQRLAGLDAFSTALAQADDTLALQVTRNGQTRELDLDTNINGSVRTALRPDLDARGELRGDARVGTENSGTLGTTTSPGATTGTATVPGAAAQGARATNPTAPIPGARAVPTSPAAPGTPTQPVPSGTPTRPVPAGTPTSPSAPRQPLPGTPPAAAPGIPTPAPAAPTAPRAEAGATGSGATGT